MVQGSEAAPGGEPAGLGGEPAEPVMVQGAVLEGEAPGAVPIITGEPAPPLDPTEEQAEQIMRELQRHLGDAEMQRAADILQHGVPPEEADLGRPQGTDCCIMFITIVMQICLGAMCVSRADAMAGTETCLAEPEDITIQVGNETFTGEQVGGGITPDEELRVAEEWEEAVHAMRTFGVVTLVVAGLAITMPVVAVCMGWLSDSPRGRNALACLLVLYVLTLLGFTVATLVYLVIFTLNFIDILEPCEGHSHVSKMRAMVIFMWAVWAVSAIQTYAEQRRKRRKRTGWGGHAGGVQQIVVNQAPAFATPAVQAVLVDQLPPGATPAAPAPAPAPAPPAAPAAPEP